MERNEQPDCYGVVLGSYGSVHISWHGCVGCSWDCLIILSLPPPHSYLLLPILIFSHSYHLLPILISSSPFLSSPILITSSPFLSPPPHSYLLPFLSPPPHSYLLLPILIFSHSYHLLPILISSSPFFPFSLGDSTIRGINAKVCGRGERWREGWREGYLCILHSQQPMCTCIHCTTCACGGMVSAQLLTYISFHCCRVHVHGSHQVSRFHSGQVYWSRTDWDPEHGTVKVSMKGANYIMFSSVSERAFQDRCSSPLQATLIPGSQLL